MATEPLSYAARQVRQYDRERFVTTLFAPAGRREALWALYAFNLEVASVRERVREPMLGQIRLQWWRDSLDALYLGGRRHHEVADALAEAVQAHDLTRSHFNRLLEARERDLTDQPPETLAELEGYADDTAATISALALEVLAARGEGAQAAGQHVGIAWSLVGILRAIPFHAGGGRLMLPTGPLAERGVHTGEVLAGKSSPGLAAVVEEIAAKADEHLVKARRLRPEVPPGALAALLPAVQAGAHLADMRRRRFDPFDRRWPVTPAGPARVALAAWLRRF